MKVNLWSNVYANATTAIDIARAAWANKDLTVTLCSTAGEEGYRVTVVGNKLTSEEFLVAMLYLQDSFKRA